MNLCGALRVWYLYDGHLTLNYIALRKQGYCDHLFSFVLLLEYV